MNLIRPEAMMAIMRMRELLGALAMVIVGLWLFSAGGAFFKALGVGVIGGAAAIAWVGLQRMRFRTLDDGPGFVRLDEGQVAYYGPDKGGFVALSELNEITLVFDEAGHRYWRLVQSPRESVTIPVNAHGAAALYDVFVSLPGARAGAFLTALDRRPGDGAITLWRREARLALT
ncbi:hypothetical protein EV663_101114 [Rhodovulum bhavnagarense]|uniref:Uncharacterized protein n=1 Tax=Rhodovulum bhavnagarense TaxID=992286 RepID=A0A4R2RJ22_9RHOB|nr:hypothetical protein [Rhodovulum bhavnagarense]TCP62854.1 hypothetical protein EV663_101114 [Rhodovulum bhavnagarense]